MKRGPTEKCRAVARYSTSMSLPCKIDKKGSMRPLAQCVREIVGLSLASEVCIRDFVVGRRCGQGSETRVNQVRTRCMGNDV
jgi:hypothetical protein